MIFFLLSQYSSPVQLTDFFPLAILTLPVLPSSLGTYTYSLIHYSIMNKRVRQRNDGKGRWTQPEGRGVMGTNMEI